MMFKAHEQDLWGALTTPHAADADMARREYMTRVISLIMAVVALGLLLIFAAGWLLGLLPFDSVLITLGMTLAFGGAWWLAYRGQWRAAGYIPPAIIFLTAVYGNWIGGTGAPAMVLYALAIVLTAILQGERVQWITLALSIAAYLLIGWALLSGSIVQLRFPETAFANRVVVVVGGYVSLASLLWFLIHEFRRSLVQTRVYADQLAVANRQLEQEISVRQQADELLRQSSEALQALVDCSPLAIIKLDAAGQVSLWNHAAEELYGWTRAEVLGKFIPMIPEKHLPDYQAIMARLLKGETLINLEVERQRKDGTLILVNLSMAPLRDAQGAITAFMSIVGDITESYRAKAALHESEERFRLFMQHFPGLAYIKDDATRVLFANQGFQDYLNIAPAAILGKSDQDIFPGEFGEQITVDDQRVLASGASEVVEEHYAGRVWSTHKFVISQTDKPALLGGFTLDITERKQAEEALRESQALYRSFIEQLPTPAFRKDQAGCYVMVNSKFCQIKGVKAEDFLGRKPAEVGLSEFAKQGEGGQAVKYAARGEETHELIMRTGQVVETEEEHAGADGGNRYMQVIRMPVFDSRGKIVGTQGLQFDITARKRVEEALREKTAELDRYFTNALDLLCIADTDGYFRRLNKEWESTLGYSIQELEGTRFLDYVHPDDRETTLAALSRLGEQKEVLNFVNQYRSKDGSYRWIEWRSSPVGKMIYAAARDITERKQVEAQREELIRELEAKNAELERFTYTVSHDLKSPLVTIMGFLGYLQKDALAGDIDQLQLDMQRIAAAAGRMQHLLGDLLELSRIGRMMNPPEAVPLTVIVQEALALTRGQIDERGVQIDIAPDLPVVLGDRVRLVEVLQNLIDNACKFMGDQPEPRITIGWRGADETNTPIMFVRDNGLGIEPQYHGKIFGLFDKLDPKSEGTGIGLAIVKRIVEVHGGRIWVESAGLNQGATFLFTLPLKSSKSSAGLPEVGEKGVK